MQKNSEYTKIERKSKLFLLIVLYANFTRFVQVSIIDIGLPNYVLYFAGTLSAYGLVVGIFSLTQSIFQFPIAVASDKIGRKIMIIISIIIYAIGTFLCFLAENILQLIIFRAIQGIGAYSSIIQAMVGDYYRKEHGKGMSLYSFTITIGYFGGFIIGGLISYYLGVRAIFLIAGILALISIFIIVIFLKEAHELYSEANETERTSLKESIKISNIKVILKEKQFRFIIFINSIRWLLFFGIYYYIIWVIQVHYKVDQIQAAYVLVLIVFLYAVFIILGGFLVDRIGHKKTMIIGQILIISFGFLFFIVSGYIIFLIVNIFASIGFAMLETAGNAYLSKILEETCPSLKGSGFGFNNSIGYFCSGVGPMLIAFLGELNTFLPYYIISFIIIGSLLTTIKFIKD